LASWLAGEQWAPLNFWVEEEFTQLNYIKKGDFLVKIPLGKML
jgi:hypothetical protein